MNLPSLIPALAGGVLAIFSFQTVYQDQPPARQSGVYSAVVRIYQKKTHKAPDDGQPTGWAATESLLDRNPEDFRELSGQEIEACALALQGMMGRVEKEPMSSRGYLRTRLQALREHIDYARNELLKLPSSQSDETFLPSHAHFFLTLTSLEQAVSQAASELSTET